MSRSSSFPAPPERTASVLPLRGGRAHAPSSVLVRARLEEDLPAERIRSATAFFAEVCDTARWAQPEDARWWTSPCSFRVEEIARGAMLSLSEAESALADLEAASLLVAAERGYRIDADGLCECPALSGFDLDAAREALQRRGELVGPATAVLREVLRIADETGTATTTLPRLVEATLYGRTRLTQALSVLAAVHLVERQDLPTRMVELRLQGGEVRGGGSPPPVSAASPPAATRARAGRMPLPTNASIQIGGEPVQLIPGVVPELEIGPDGRFYLWLGPVRIGPYDG